MGASLRAKVNKMKPEKRIENNELLELIQELRKAEKQIWKKVVYELSKPKKRRAEVNLDKIEKYSAEGNIVLVPGKVLGRGTLSKSISVAAFSFSDSARREIEKNGGRIYSIREVYEKDPAGKNLQIII